MMFASRPFILTFAAGTLAVLVEALAVAQTGDAVRAFSPVREAFERIRTDYVDEVDDAAVFRFAILGMTQAPNVDSRMLDSERIRRAMTLGSSSRNSNVIIRALEGAFDEIRATRRVQEQALVDSAIEGMGGGVDPHSEYINPTKWRANVASLQTGSIGLNVTLTAGSIRVVSPIPNGPAERAGIVAGDVITAVDEVPVAGWRLEQVVALFRGPLNSELVLTIVRVIKSVDVKIVRARVAQESVRFHRHEEIGYIQIVRFNEQTAAALKSALAQLQASPEALGGYVVDLRDNMGGLLEQAVAATELFVGRGPIASTRGRAAHATQRFEAHAGDLTQGALMAVLIDESTAAGAEIMAAALQERGRATIVGMPSAGAGTVQTIIPLGDNRGALRLTTSRVHTASGRALEGSGVTPDLVVVQAAVAASAPLAPVDDRQLQAALKHLKASAPR